jgi:hydroxymethylpyrimidine/phosphomethylpyrimidine kinase
MNVKVPIALTVAGSDPSGGAGLQEDIKVFTELGVHCVSCVTAVTVQSTFGISRSYPVEGTVVAEQISCILEDRTPLAAKTGLLAKECLGQVALFLNRISFPVVVDPIFASGTGFLLADSQDIEFYKTQIIPSSAIVTPNVPELQALIGSSVTQSSMFEGAARKLLEIGAKAVLIKGGHLAEDQVVDLFLSKTDARRFVRPRRGFKNVHGTGCALSAAITAFLARGSSLIDAVASAEAYIDRKLADILYAGEGAPILNHIK